LNISLALASPVQQGAAAKLDFISKGSDRS